MKRNSVLDVLKGLAILFVIITHYAWTKTQKIELFFYFWIGLAVPIFMVITGYVYYKSFQKNKIEKLSQAYAPENIIPRFLRFGIPFVMAYIIEVLLAYHDRHKLGIKQIVINFLIGGETKYGSYYILILFQFVIIFPLIYFLVKKKGFLGVLICAGINLGYELFATYIHIGGMIHKHVVLRFVFIIAFGCYIAFSENLKFKKIWSIFSLCIGAIYMLDLMYKFYPIDLFSYWEHVNMVSCLFLLPIMSVLIKKCRFSFMPLEILGRASFNIFLVQKSYYRFVARVIYKYIDGFYPRLIMNIVICCVIGVIFYYIEDPITKKIVRGCKKRLSNLSFPLSRFTL